MLDSTATARTFQVIEPFEEDSPFEYIDTASARADINMIAQKLAVDKLAIVGVGGVCVPKTLAGDHFRF